MEFNISTIVLVWFSISIAFFLIELAVPGFVLMFFGIGALVTSALLALGIIDSLFSQLVVFIIVSILSLVVFRFMWKGSLWGDVSHKRKLGEGLEEVKGKKAKVLSEIRPLDIGGKVELFGTVWEAESEFIIEKGTTVEVIGRDNLVLKVKPIE